MSIHTGSQFVCSGKDPDLFVYDEMTKKRLMILGRNMGTFGGGNVMSGHASRVLCCKYISEDKTIVSGGWDSTVQFWDQRSGGSRSVRSI